MRFGCSVIQCQVVCLSGQSIHCVCGQEVVGEVVVVGIGILNNDNKVGGGVVDENACDMSLVRLVVRSLDWLIF